MRQFDPKEYLSLPWYRGAYLTPSTADGKVGCVGPGKLDVRANHATRQRGLNAERTRLCLLLVSVQSSGYCGSLASMVHSTRPAFLPFFERMIDCRMGRVDVLIKPRQPRFIFLCGIDRLRVPAGGNGKKQVHLVTFQFCSQRERVPIIYVKNVAGTESQLPLLL